MKKLIYFISFLCASLCHIPCYATHVYGGELLYRYISGNQYELTLTLYGDCSAASNIFNGLFTATPYILIYHDNRDSSIVQLPPVAGIGEEVSPVCPAQINNTTCNGGWLPGVKKFTYIDTITLNVPSASWHFLFDGRLDGSSTAGRSNQITNVAGAGGTNVYLEATLNNLAGPNSSPEYTTIPTPFYTINIPQQYNQGAVDADGDSLSFELVAAMHNGHPVVYNSYPAITLSATTPMVTDSGEFTFNGINGQMSFTPSILQDALIVNQVTEYKNGIVVGTSKREMTFVVLDNLALDYVQHTNADNISGGYTTGNNIIYTCVGTPSVSFDINPVDTAHNDIQVSYISLPGNSNLSVQNNNTTAPTLHFSWNTDSIPAGIYNFFVNYKNNACPISTTQTIAYTINVVNPYEVVATTQNATQCYHNADVTVIIKNGALPATINITKDGNPVTAVTGNTDTIVLSLPAGSYGGMVSAPGLTGCSAPFSFSIIDSGAYPFGPEINMAANYCIHDSAAAIVALADTNAIIQWYTAAGDSIPAAPIPPTDTAGVYTWYVTQQVGPCSSEKEAVTVHVYDKPELKILSEQGTVCIGEIIYLEATGGMNYDWQPIEKIAYDHAGKQYIRVFEPTEYTLYARSEFGCKDSAKLRFDKVESCCQLSYPTAFTPNGDGKNDRFKALVVGNMKYYELDIFDRWGRRLFWNSDPNATWDGTFRGKPCNADTYFYRVHAICYTGHEEDVTGTVNLLR